MFGLNKQVRDPFTITGVEEINDVSERISHSDGTYVIENCIPSKHHCILPQEGLFSWDVFVEQIIAPHGV